MLSIYESGVNPGGSKFETTSINLGEVGKKSLEALDMGDRSMQNIFAVIKLSVWGPEGAADWDENDDSQTLGLERKDLRAEIKRKIELGL